MKLTRRAVLRGAGGVVVGLPALEALVPATARAAPLAPRRFIGLYHPNGVFTPDWFPTAGATEADFTLSPIHQALAPWQRRLLFTRGVDMAVAVNGPGEQHQRGVGAFLTGAKLNYGSFVGNDGSSAGYANGQSIDQALVPIIGAGTRVPSLQLGVHSLVANVSGVVSYAAANTPLLPQNDPHLTFRTLFLDSGLPSTELDLIRARRKSVLDGVLAQAQTLQKRVSSADRARLDAHLTLVRDLENRLTTLPPGACAKPVDPGELTFTAEEQFGVVAGLQVSLLGLALRCDLTRVATVMFSDAQNHLALPHLDIHADIHNLTHYADGDPLRAPVGVRDTWQAGVLAGLLADLASITEADGSTALDHTFILWGSDVSRGNVHAHDDMPFLMAGGGAGFRMGRFPQWQRAFHNDLLVSILAGFGASVSTWGEPAYCRGPLSNLT